MFKAILEIFSIFLVGATSFVSAFYLFPYAISQRSNEKEVTFIGRIEKTPLKIASPTFAEIEEIKVDVGVEFKKGDTLALLKDIAQDEDKFTDSSAMFSFDGNLISVLAPTDGIVSEILLAEKSTVKPQMDFLTLFPLEDAKIRIVSEDEYDLPDTAKLLIKSGTGNEYSLKLIDTLPTKISGNEGQVFYAEFSDQMDSKNFFAGQEVEIALRTEKEDYAFIKVEELLKNWDTLTLRF